MFVLVIGGRAQGKTEYIRNHYSLADEDIGSEIGKQRAVVHLERLIAHQGGERVLAQLSERIGAGDCIVCCDEVGMGIVPTDRKEREFRDETGRVLCALAQRADRVIRVFAGIGQVLK